jgi:uncharacterized membrane protein
VGVLIAAVTARALLLNRIDAEHIDVLACKKDGSDMMKNTVNRILAGIGYGFLVGAAGGLLIGVLTKHLLFWVVIGGIAGIVLGWLFSLIVTR